MARALKASNPKLKVFFYQPADRLGDTQYVLDLLAAHPEWWLRDDHGNLVPFGGAGRCVLAGAGWGSDHVLALC